jgi:hypothetical protein
MRSRGGLSGDVPKFEELLSDLAVNAHVAASTRNQATNPLAGVNPDGCQRVAGGRRGLWGGDLRTTGQEVFCTPAGVPDRLLSLIERAKLQFWHPAGVLTLGRGLPVVVPPLPGTTTGYPLATLRVGLGQ